MTGAAIGQIVLYAAVLMVMAWPLGKYMARVYQGEARTAQRILGPLERLIYRLGGVKADEEMSWKRYATAALGFGTLSVLLVYGLQRLQTVLPGNPNDLAQVDPRVAFNTAVSFATNTNWQVYGGESTMSHLVQAVALAVQNFVSAAMGMAVLVALVRGFVHKQSGSIGSFWVDLTRSVVYILIPLSIVLSLLLVWQGVPQTVDGRETVTLVDAAADADGNSVTEQAIAVGPVASQIAIKQLGTNGGGYYNVNSAHPLENPTPLSNFLQLLAILLIPAALCFTFGAMIRRNKQGLVFLVAMWVLFIPFLVLTLWQEQKGNPLLPEADVDQVASVDQAGGNMEGKETRHGISASALWANATAAASNGSVNSMHDSYTPLGGLSPLALMGLGEVVFGGVGSGLYGLIIFAIVAVFISGLMVGRTPEFLGKKIEAYEMKMASLAILAPAVMMLVGPALACLTTEMGGKEVDGNWVTVLANSGPHGFSEAMYAFFSQSNNNGSAFAGLTAGKTFFATMGGICMWIGRFWVIIPTLAIAGSLARKKAVPTSAGTLPTEGPMFVALLAGTVILVAALNMVPALGLGPVVEHLQVHP